jgi:DNA-binding PadR family transcriptional regulator
MSGTRRPREARALTELEGCVLGLIWSAGPCTAYAVRAELLDSPSIHWSGSAGAVYPLISRLHARGLLTARPTKQGRRRAVTYSLTRRGHSALQRWVAGTLDPWVVATPMDPLRTRVRFSGVLSGARQARLIDAALAALRAQLPDMQAFCDRYRAIDDAAYGIGRGALLIAEARIAWLEELRQAARPRRP